MQAATVLARGMPRHSPSPERLDAILDDEEELDYDYELETEPLPAAGSDMEADPKSSSMLQSVRDCPSSPALEAHGPCSSSL